MDWASFGDDEDVKIKSKPVSKPSPAGKTDWNLATDVYDTKKHVVVKINLPGVNPEEIDIAVSQDSVKISGTTLEEKEVSDDSYFMREIRCGSFERAIKLPVKVEIDQAEASYKNGILKVTLAKREENLVNKIKVKNS